MAQNATAAEGASGIVVGSGARNRQAFVEGVQLIFRNWTALKLAVEMEWGGPDSQAKAQWFPMAIVEHFDQNGSKVFADELELILDDIMTNEFQAELDDNSPSGISKLLVKLYSECVKGNFTTLDLLKQRHQASLSNAASVVSASKGSGMDSDDDDDDDDDMDGVDAGMETDAAARPSSLHPPATLAPGPSGFMVMEKDDQQSQQQSEEPERERRVRQQPVVDEDGWTTIPVKGKSRR